MAGSDATTAPAATPAPQAPAQPAVSAQPVLRPAAESTDPAVHYLIAVRDALSRDGQDTAAVTAQLAELGYE